MWEIVSAAFESYTTFLPFAQHRRVVCVGFLRRLLWIAKAQKLAGTRTPLSRRCPVMFAPGFGPCVQRLVDGFIARHWQWVSDCRLIYCSADRTLRRRAWPADWNLSVTAADLWPYSGLADSHARYTLYTAVQSYMLPSSNLRV